MTSRVLPLLMAAAWVFAPAAVYAQDGAAVYARNCAGCHNTMNNAAYKGRPVGTLTSTVIAGKGTMKPRAGNSRLTDNEIRAAVTHLLSRAR